MSWDYAELSKMAKSGGGPENYVNSIEENSWAEGYKEGQLSMIPWLGIAALVGSALAYGGNKIKVFFNEKKDISQKKINEAKDQLVQGIKNYNATHQENDDGTMKQKEE